VFECQFDILKWVEGPLESLYNSPMIEMIKVKAGKLRAIGYDAKLLSLRVVLDDGSSLEYVGVRENIWQNLKSSGAQWSYYRDNIEEEFKANRVSSKPLSLGKNPLDDLFN
jgi:hypothetical protein